MILPVLGHVDHGKTALVRALTGMETDRLPEERRRGLSIVLGFAHATFGEEIDFIDAPGHERFIRTLVPGVSGASCALLVVAATEGVRPQTREHVLIARRLGVSKAVLALTKSDLASAQELSLAGAQGQALLSVHGIQMRSALPVSAVTGKGVAALKKALADLAAAAPAPPDRGAPFLPVDRAFLAPGRGAVVTGGLRGGSLSQGQALEILPEGGLVRVRELQIHGASVSCAPPGSRVALNLAGADPDRLRGRTLAPPGTLGASLRLNVLVSLAPEAPDLRNGVEVEVLLGAARASGRLLRLGPPAAPGEGAALAQLRLKTPLAASGGEPFVLRLSSPATTLGGGRVLDPDPGSLPRPLERILLASLARAPEEDAARARILLDSYGIRGVSAARLSRWLATSSARAAEAAGRTGAVAVGGLLVGSIHLEELTSRLEALLAPYAKGLAPGEILRRLEPVAPAVLAGALRRLKDEGRVALEHGRARPIVQEREAGRRIRAEALARSLAEGLRRSGLTPPDPPPEALTPEGRRVLEGLIRSGVLVRTRDRVQAREIIFHREALEEARRRLKPHLRPPGLRVGEAGQLLGVSRKFAVPLLEHLDAVRFTVRDGDRRVLGPGLAL